MILATGGTLTVLDSTFTDNGAGGIVGVQLDLTVENTVFSGGYNGQNGSDIYVVNTLIEPVVIRDSIFDFSTSWFGGAVSTQDAPFQSEDGAPHGQTTLTRPAERSASPKARRNQSNKDTMSTRWVSRAKKGPGA